MDREGDSYDLWAELITASSRFVIRNSRRRILDNGEWLSDVIEHSPCLCPSHGNYCGSDHSRVTLTTLLQPRR
jgi:hypothetical protein